MATRQARAVPVAAGTTVSRKKVINTIVILGVVIGATVTGVLLYNFFSGSGDGSGDGGGGGSEKPQAPRLSQPKRTSVYPPYSILVTYTSVPGASSYRVYRSTEPFYAVADAKRVASKSVLSFTDYVQSVGVYYYAVTAMVNGYESSMSECLSVSISVILFPPTEPPVLSVPALLKKDSPYTVLLSYTSIEGSLDYTVYRSTVPLLASNKDSATKSRAKYTSYVDVVETEATYYYGVASANADGESELSNVVSIVVARTVPVLYTPQQTGVTAPYAVNLKWTPVAGAASYNIYYSGVGYEKTGTPISSVIGQTVTEKTVYVSLLNRYFFAIRASTSTTISELSNWASVLITTPTIAQGVPTIASVTKTRSTSPFEIMVRYSPDQYATAYKIYRSDTPFTTASGATLLATTSSPTNIYVDTTTSTGMLYYGVASVISGVEGEMSLVRGINIAAAPTVTVPAAPVMQTPTKTDDYPPYNVVLSFTMPLGATSFNLYRSASTFSESTKVSATVVLTSTSPPFTDPLVTSGKFFYAVSASNENGEGPLSNVDSVTIVPPPLDAPVLVVTKCTSSNPYTNMYYITTALSFTRVEGAAYYKVYGSMNTDFDSPFFALDVPQVSVNAIPCSHSVSYMTTVRGNVGVYYKVYAVSEDPTRTDGPYSNVAIGITTL